MMFVSIARKRKYTESCGRAIDPIAFFDDHLIVDVSCIQNKSTNVCAPTAFYVVWAGKVEEWTTMMRSHSASWIALSGLLLHAHWIQLSHLRQPLGGHSRLIYISFYRTERIRYEDLDDQCCPRSAPATLQSPNRIQIQSNNVRQTPPRRRETRLRRPRRGR